MYEDDYNLTNKRIWQRGIGNVVLYGRRIKYLSESRIQRRLILSHKCLSCFVQRSEIDVSLSHEDTEVL